MLVSLNASFQTGRKEMLFSAISEARIYNNEDLEHDVDLNIGNLAAVFQAEVLYIYTHSVSSVESVRSPYVDLSLVKDCKVSLDLGAIAWLPGHFGVYWNEKPDEL